MVYVESLNFIFPKEQCKIGEQVKDYSVVFRFNPFVSDCKRLLFPNPLFILEYPAFFDDATGKTNLSEL